MSSKLFANELEIFSSQNRKVYFPMWQKSGENPFCKDCQFQLYFIRQRSSASHADLYSYEMVEAIKHYNKFSVKNLSVSICSQTMLEFDKK